MENTMVFLRYKFFLHLMKVEKKKKRKSGQDSTAHSRLSHIHGGVKIAIYSFSPYIRLSFPAPLIPASYHWHCCFPMPIYASLLLLHPIYLLPFMWVITCPTPVHEKYIIKIEQGLQVEQRRGGRHPFFSERVLVRKNSPQIILPHQTFSNCI